MASVNATPGSAPQPSTSTSRSLLERVRADDPAAWERLVGLYSPLVYHWCRQYGVQEHDAADVFQEVFQSIATHLGSFRREKPGDTFRGWVRTITHNKVLDHFRRRGREPQATGGSEAQQRLTQAPADSDASDDSSHDGALERGLFHRALEMIRGEFEERTWRAFWRTAVDGEPAHDAAAELGMSPGAVRVAKSRVLQRLREELGDLME
jgi:RNA polymerase sigma-70 factor, ECF subfamily